MHEQHKKLFNDVIRATLRTTMPEDQQAFLDKTAKGFAAGAGSVLFFEDQDALRLLGEQHSASKAAISEWSDASSGMAQFNGTKSDLVTISSMPIRLTSFPT